MAAIRPILMRAALFLLCFFLFGCATKSTVQTRRVEKQTAYDSLSAEDKAMVDAEQIRVGMSMDAVYIAWGKPSQVLDSEDASGRYTTWHYYGSWLQENRYWAYRETNRGGGRGPSLERYLTSDYSARDYVQSEIVFKGGKVLSWRTLPKPLE